MISQNRLPLPAALRRPGAVRLALVVASLALFGAVTAVARQTPSATASRPNIVVILADDLGYGDIGAFNPAGRVPTPHVDRLAREGVRYTDAHTTSSVCTPTRYGLLTGRYAWRTSLTRGVLWGEGDPLIEPDRATLASMLKEAGYTTAAIGKWHLGLGWAARPGATPSTRTQNQVEWIDYTKPYTRGPTTLGFDRFFGIAASLDMPPYVYLQGDRVTAQPTERLPGVPQGDPAFYRPGIAAPGFDPASVLNDFTASAVEFIASSRPPFFLYLALAAPHTPVMPSAEFRGRTGVGTYGDFVAETDHAVGQILAALQKAGAADRTLVLFTSDNGPAPLGGIAEAASHGHDASGGWRGVKAGLYEGGHRVPFVVRWPGVAPAGRASARPILTTDLMATVADVIGTALPQGAAEDSVSFAANLREPSRFASRAEPMVLHSANGAFAIRDRAWKLILAPGSGAGNEPPSPAALPVQLFDLNRDPKETTNLATSRPEIVKRLEAMLNAERKRSGRK